MIDRQLHSSELSPIYISIYLMHKQIFVHRKKKKRINIGKSHAYNGVK